jgi:TfoX/Sxy family transcriptional regulator of competence genes
MAYDERLAERIRELTDGEPGLSEKRMFGGLAFLVDGRLAVASGRDGIMLRVDPAESEALTRSSGVRRTRMRGRELAGWLDVDAAALEREDDLRHWVARGLAFARSLPA